MASKKIDSAILKVLKGEWTAFDFITNFKTVNSSNEMEVFFSELTEAIQLFELDYYAIPYCHTDESGETVVIENTSQRYSQYNVLELDGLHDYYRKQYKATRTQQPEPEPFDLSDTSAVEKIIYLNELGIIDFLKTKPEFIGSTNLMATLLSAITDVKASTLQTSLNRLINNDTDDKNHPYRTKKTVERVRQTLIDKNIKPKTS